MTPPMPPLPGGGAPHPQPPRLCPTCAVEITRWYDYRPTQPVRIANHGSADDTLTRRADVLRARFESWRDTIRYQQDLIRRQCAEQHQTTTMCPGCEHHDDMRPTMLDGFCGAGGCGMGYHRAGFCVTGVDREPQPRYPFRFVQADAVQYIADHGARFAAIGGSPPCWAYTTMSNRYRGRGHELVDNHPRLIAPTREAMLATGRPYVIENVPGARPELRSPLLLSGGMFGLNVDRPRLFETNVLVMQPARVRVPNPIGVYGDLNGRRLKTRRDGTEQRAARTLAEAQAAMGIDWMEWSELTQAIPPAYTEYIGRTLLAHVRSSAAAAA